jgi:hypothetical protein
MECVFPPAGGKVTIEKMVGFVLKVAAWNDTSG